jgi:hypothetical protein
VVRRKDAGAVLLDLHGADEVQHGFRSLEDAFGNRLLLRVSQMTDDLPQITELDLSPVIARRDGALAADARIFLQPAKSTDAYLRQLR